MAARSSTGACSPEVSSELGDRDLLVGAARGVGLVERLLRAEDGHLERLAAQLVVARLDVNCADFVRGNRRGINGGSLETGESCD